MSGFIEKIEILLVPVEEAHGTRTVKVEKSNAIVHFLNHVLLVRVH